MSELVRVSPTEAKALMDGNNAMLVASYETGFKFDAVNVEGAIAIDTFKSKAADLAKDAEIIFY